MTLAVGLFVGLGNLADGGEGALVGRQHSDPSGPVGLTLVEIPAEKRRVGCREGSRLADPPAELVHGGPDAEEGSALQICPKAEVAVEIVVAGQQPAYFDLRIPGAQVSADGEV